MKTFYKYLFILIPTVLLSEFTYKNDSCYAITQEDKYIGLTKFNTKEEFIKTCNARLYFLYKEDKCRVFTMKKMKFDIYIKDKLGTKEFKQNETIKVCGKEILEFLK